MLSDVLSDGFHIVSSRLQSWTPTVLQGHTLMSPRLRGRIPCGAACICIGFAHIELSGDLDPSGVDLSAQIVLLE